MYLYKKHIAFKIFTLIVVVSLLVPSAIKFTHAFAHHKHEVCLGGNNAHLHTLDLECEFYKFKTNTPFTLVLFNIDLFLSNTINERITSQYHFISDYQRLQISLRGPPSLI